MLLLMNCANRYPAERLVFLDSLDHNTPTNRTILSVQPPSLANHFVLLNRGELGTSLFIMI